MGIKRQIRWMGVACCGVPSVTGTPPRAEGLCLGLPGKSAVAADLASAVHDDLGDLESWAWFGAVGRKLFAQSLFGNYERACGRGFWLWPRRQIPSIPAVGCKEGANAGQQGKDPPLEGCAKARRLSHFRCLPQSQRPTPGVFSFVAPGHPAFGAKTGPLVVSKQTLIPARCHRLPVGTALLIIKNIFWGVSRRLARGLLAEAEIRLKTLKNSREHLDTPVEKLF